MRMTDTPFEGAQPIDAYGAGGFRIGGARREGAQIVAPSGPRDWPAAVSLDALTAAAAADLAFLVDEADFVLIGVGGRLARPSAAFTAALEAAGLAYEVMTTPSACRSYNVLASEGRRVAAAILAV